MEAGLLNPCPSPPIIDRDLHFRIFRLKRLHDILVGLAVILVGCAIVHWQVQDFQFVNWDDDLHVVRNQAVTAPADVPLRDHLLTPYLGYPVPVTVGSYIFDNIVAGLDPGWFHTANLLIHVLISLIIYFIAMHLGCRVPLAVACTLLFALHPAVGEPVAWVSGRKDLLAAAFSVLALWSFMSVPDRDRQIRSRAPAAVLLLLAALSKPSALLVPILPLMLDLARRPDGRDSAVKRRWPKNRLPGAAVWIVVLAANAALALVAYRLEKGMGALDGADVSGGNVLVRVLAGAGWHARILAWPFDLMPKYLDPVGGPSVWTLVVGGAVILVVLGLTAWTLLRRHPAFVGLALAVLAYVPQSGVMPLSRQYANSYVYLTLAGLALAAGAALAPLMSRMRGPVRVAVAGAAIVALAGLGLAAHSQEKVYADGVSLWATVYQVYPDSPQVCRNLGNAWMYGAHDDPVKAAATYEHCIQTLGNRPFFLKNLAIAQYRAGNSEVARSLFLEMVETQGPDAVTDKYLRLLGRP